jgi:hypothetical protein
MGLHGKKKRRVSKGEKNATPSPPFVIASKTPCEAVMTHRRMLWLIFLPQPPPSRNPTVVPMSRANKRE